jgi:hypothetical protein
MAFLVSITYLCHTQTTTANLNISESSNTQPAAGPSQALATPFLSSQVSSTNPFQPLTCTGLIPNPIQVTAQVNKLPKNTATLPNFKWELRDSPAINVFSGKIESLLLFQSY